jgi:hypothetical protein
MSLLAERWIVLLRAAMASVGALAVGGLPMVVAAQKAAAGSGKGTVTRNPLRIPSVMMTCSSRRMIATRRC